MSYVKPQYNTPSADRKILAWLNGDHSDESVEIVAKYMSHTLCIGGISICRQFVRCAIDSVAA